MIEIFRALNDRRIVLWREQLLLAAKVVRQLTAVLTAGIGLIQLNRICIGRRVMILLVRTCSYPLHGKQPFEITPAANGLLAKFTASRLERVSTCRPMPSFLRKALGRADSLENTALQGMADTHKEGKTSNIVKCVT